MKKYFEWDPAKNDWLKTNRGISFEEIISCIELGGLLEITDHPKKSQYRNQKIFAVKANNYVYLVPFVENELKYFLKTIIPNRKATKKYLKGDV